MTEEDPKPAFAVSPDDQSSDRAQSDDNNTVAVAERAVASQERADLKKLAEDNQLVTNSHIDKLAKASAEQTASNKEFAMAMVEYQERAKTARKRFIATIILILMGFAVLAWRQQDANDSAGKARKIIVSCVTPAGQCYKDSRDQTAGAVLNLSQVSSIAAACATAPEYAHLRLPARVVAVQACIKKNLPK